MYLYLSELQWTKPGTPWRRQIGQITGRPAQKTMYIIVCLINIVYTKQCNVAISILTFFNCIAKKYEQKAEKEGRKGNFLVPGFWILDSGN